MEQCNACVEPQGEGKTSCQDRKNGYFNSWTWAKIGNNFWWFLFSVVLLSDHRICNFPECDLWRIWEPIKVEPEQLLKSIKLWATHTSLDATLSKKSHFFWWDCCTVNQAYKINEVIQRVKKGMAAPQAVTPTYSDLGIQSPTFTDTSPNLVSHTPSGGLSTKEENSSRSSSPLYGKMGNYLCFFPPGTDIQKMGMDPQSLSPTSNYIEVKTIYQIFFCTCSRKDL